jgi:hypothetical protein
MANLFSQSEVESILGLQPGQATGGYAQNLIASNPALNQKYMNAVNQRVAQNQAGMTDRSGVAPVTIEPLHQFAREGWTKLGAGVQPQRDPLADEMLRRSGALSEEAADYYRTGAAPVTGQEISDMMSPYDQAVTERSVTNLSEQAQRMREEMMRRMGSDRPNANFVDLYGAQRMGDIDEQMIKTSGDIRTTGAQQSWQDALKRAYANRGLQTTGGSGLGGLAASSAQAGGVAQNAAGAGFQNAMASVIGQIGAGESIRGFNQQATDLATQNFFAPQQFENALTQSATGYNPNAASFKATPVNQAADILQGLGGLAQKAGKVEW